MAGNFFVTLTLAGAMQYLYGMVNALQIVVLGIFTNCMTPTNSKVIQVELFKTVSFDIFDTENIYTSWFGFGDSPTLSDAFEEANMDGSNFILGLGPMFMIIVIFPLYMMSHRCMKYVFQDGIKSKCIKNFIKPK